MGKHRKPPNGPIGPDERGYDVGYRKPPMQTQFQPGKSGNPSGGVKKPPSLRASLEKALSKEITATTADGPVTMSMMEVMATKMVNASAKGGVGITKILTGLVVDHEIGEVERPDDMSAADMRDFEKLHDILRGPGK